MCPEGFVRGRFVRFESRFVRNESVARMNWQALYAFEEFYESEKVYLCSVNTDLFTLFTVLLAPIQNS